MKKLFTAVNDYGTGAVVVRIYAGSKADIEALLTEPTWKIYSSDDPNCPQYSHTVLESDIDDQEDWLERLIYIQQRKAEGKQSFPVRGRRWGIFVAETNLWARSKAEVETRFPSLEFRYHVPWSSTRHSDIDVRDDFISRHEIKGTESGARSN